MKSVAAAARGELKVKGLAGIFWGIRYLSVVQLKLNAIRRHVLDVVMK
jgi:hypothetical protein